MAVKIFVVGVEGSRLSMDSKEERKDNRDEENLCGEKCGEKRIGTPQVSLLGFLY